MAGSIRWVVCSAFLFGAAVARPAEVHAGACARPEISTRALTKPGAELAKGGGVVVAMEDAAKAPAMTFGKSAATKAVLGAGLVVYTPPAGTGAVALQWKGKDLVALKRGGDAKVVDAPKVASITYSSNTGRRGTYVGVAVDVTGGIPPGVVAVAVYDDKGKLRSWGDASNYPPPEPGVKSQLISVYASGSCVVQPNGFVPSAIDDKVQVAYIDASGRISAKTAVTVKAAPLPKNTIGP